MGTCCSGGEHVCSDFRTQFCKNPNDFNPTVDAGIGGATCLQATTMIDPFNATKTSCVDEKVQFGDDGNGNANMMTRLPLLGMLRTSCCSGQETVCDEFRTKVCKVTSDFDGSADAGVGGATCDHVASMMVPFSATKTDCEAEIELGDDG